MTKLKNFKLVFCDNSKAIKFAWNQGLSKNIPIITHSPFLCLSEVYNTKSFNNYFKGSLPYFGKYIKEVCLEIEKKIIKDKTYSFFRNSIYLALHDATNLFARLSILNDNHLKKKILLINVDTGNDNYNNIINTNFEKVFSKEINYEVITYQLSIKEKQKVHKNMFFLNNKNNFFDYLKFFLSFKFLNPINFIYYFWKHTKFNSPKGNFIYVYDNPIINDTFKYFILKGFGIKKINDPKILKVDKKKQFKEIDVILDKIHPIISKFIKKKFCSKLKNGLEKYIHEKIKYFLYQNIVGITWWENEIKKILKKKPLAILTNIATDPTGPALYPVCLKNKIPLFKFQHGVCIEFSATNCNRDHISESTDSDILFCYNKNYYNLDKKNKFAVSKKIPVGMPSSYWKKPRRLYMFKSTPDFFYVDTISYSGNRHFIENQTDDFLAYNGIKLLRKVFSKIKYNILYKYYPQLPLYLDEDPIKRETKKFNNIIVYDKNKNLNEISSSAKVLITSRATSTLSFCIMQNKPIIFIDWPNSKPLRKLALKHLKKYLFYFNAGDKDFENKLRSFLNKGPDYIEKEFLNKKKKYQQKAFNYIQTGGKFTGIRVAKAIEEYLFKRKLN